MKVQLDKITVTTVEAELPETCPNCKADLTEEESLREDQYTASNQRCQMIPNEDRLDEYGSSEECYDLQYVVGYACAKCDHILVSTEESSSTKQETANGAAELETTG